MTTFIVSDTHFSHKGVTQFTRDDGSPLRPWDNIAEMDEALVENWNRVVTPKDKVYHLGDTVMNRKALPILDRLNGDKVLILGNHDFSCTEMLKYFRDVRAMSQFDGFVLTHIPLHPDSLYRWNGNIHGHLHADRVMLNGKPDPRYLCVCVEHTDYTPIPWDEVKARFNAQQVQY